MTDIKDEKLQNLVQYAFDIDELVVSEELISRTLEASKSVEQVSPDEETPVNPPVRTFSTRVTATYFGTFAAACLVICALIAVPMLSKSSGKGSSAASGMKMEMTANDTAAVAEEVTAAFEVAEAPGSPEESAAPVSESMSADSGMPTLEEESSRKELFDYAAGQAGAEDGPDALTMSESRLFAAEGESGVSASDTPEEEVHRAEKTGIAPDEADEHEGINAVVDASSDAGEYFESKLKALIGKSCTKLSTERDSDGTGNESGILLKFKVNYADGSFEIHSLWADGVYSILRRFPADDAYSETDYITLDLDAFLNELVNMIN